MKIRIGNILAVWDIDLTDDEMKAIASGVSPFLIRPENLTYAEVEPVSLEPSDEKQAGRFMFP